MDKKYLNGNLERNIAFGLCWLLSIVLGGGWIAAIVFFFVDKDVLDLEDKRELVSIVICFAACILLSLTFVVPLYVLICQIIACVQAFMGKTFKIPGVYQIAAAIIK